MSEISGVRRGAGAIHEAAAVGFGSAAAEYERARPDYPAQAVERIVSLCSLTSESRVLDLACGTGKMTRILSATSRARIVGLDPIEPMLLQFRSVLTHVPCVGGTAERIPFADASFDACIVAQAFHWFKGDDALAEIHRVLEPSSVLVAIWNTRDESVPWVAAMNSIFDRYEGDVMRFWRGGWKPAFEQTRLFTPLQREDFVHQQTLTRQGMVDRVLSVSFIATLPAAERKVVADRMLEILDDDPATRGKQDVVLSYRTQLYWCRRL
ncbi:MAG: class I SAM-dependent methyltransferase [Actinomycetota bacterium]